MALSRFILEQGKPGKLKAKNNEKGQMKRYRYIIEEIIDEANMNENFDYVMRGKKRKRSHAGRLLMKNREAVIKKLQKRIDDGFPFRTTIKRTTFNGKSKYSLT